MALGDFWRTERHRLGADRSRNRWRQSDRERDYKRQGGARHEQAGRPYGTSGWSPGGEYYSDRGAGYGTESYGGARYRGADEQYGGRHWEEPQRRYGGGRDWSEQGHSYRGGGSDWREEGRNEYGDRDYYTTMVLIGLWHGITLNYLFWGLWHGLGLFLQDRWSGFVRGRLPTERLPGAVRGGLGFLSLFLTFSFVSLGWLFFILPTPSLAWQAFLKLFGVA